LSDCDVGMRNGIRNNLNHYQTNSSILLDFLLRLLRLKKYTIYKRQIRFNLSSIIIITKKREEINKIEN
jgi:hypothetical protein